MLLIPVAQRTLLVILFLEIRLFLRSLKPYVHFPPQHELRSLIFGAGLNGCHVLFPGSSALKKAPKSRRTTPHAFSKHLRRSIVLFDSLLFFLRK